MIFYDFIIYRHIRKNQPCAVSGIQWEKRPALQSIWASFLRPARVRALLEFRGCIQVALLEVWMQRCMCRAVFFYSYDSIDIVIGSRYCICLEIEKCRNKLG
jgi:hypothetical protein